MPLQQTDPSIVILEESFHSLGTQPTWSITMKTFQAVDALKRFANENYATFKEFVKDNGFDDFEEEAQNVINTANAYVLAHQYSDFKEIQRDYAITD